MDKQNTIDYKLELYKLAYFIDYAKDADYDCIMVYLHSLLGVPKQAERNTHYNEQYLECFHRVIDRVDWKLFDQNAPWFSDYVEQNDKK